MSIPRNLSKLAIGANTSGVLAVANGGTGTATPSIVAGTNVTVTGTWPNQTVAASGGSATPAGSNTQVQFNNAGAFGASANLTFNGGSLLASGDSTLASVVQIKGSTSVSKGAGFQSYFSGATYGGVYWDAPVDAMIFESKVNTEMLRLNTNGNMALKGGTTTATGVGITFPATQSASTDANCLDDYEEGTWTPVVSSQSGSLTGYTSTGKYTKIGRTVTVTFNSAITSPGTASGAMSISGFPFTNGNSYQAPTLCREAAQVGTAYQALLNGSATNGYVKSLTEGAISWAINTEYTFVLTYFA
jgi:hypothetical protein